MIPEHLSRAGPFRVRYAEPPDAIYLAERMRPWDMVECLAAGLDPAAALMDPIIGPNAPDTYALEKDGELIAMGGVSATEFRDLGAIWLLGTDELERGGLAFLGLSRLWVAHALTRYRSLCNVVPARAETTIRWLRWLGFDIHPEFVHLRGIRFLRFRMDRHDGPNSASAP